MVRRIRSLLYEQGFTISGARQRLKEMPRGNSHAADGTRHAGSVLAVGKPRRLPVTTDRRGQIQHLSDELESLLRHFPEYASPSHQWLRSLPFPPPLFLPFPTSLTGVAHPGSALQ